MEVDLGAVECAVPLVDGIFELELVERGAQRVRRRLPVLVRADGIFGAGGELDGVFETEELIHLVDDAHDPLDLLRDLLGQHEDVRVVLREAAHAHEPVQLSALFVAVHDAQLAHADGKILIAVRLRLVHEQPARAVHGLDGAVLAVDLGGVHIFPVVVPVPRRLPERTIQDDGCLHLDIPLTAVDLPPVVDEGILQDHAVGQEERKALALRQERKQLHLLAELDVVALLCLLEQAEILVHLLLLGERRAIDAGEHLLFLIPPPVGARDGDKAECLDPARGGKVRPAAEVDECTLAVEGDLLPLRQILDELHLVLFMIFAHEGDRFLAGKGEALDGQIALDDVLHLRLDLGKVLHRDGRSEVDIVVKPVVDDGTDGKLAGGIDGLERLRQNVRAGMAVHLQPFLVLEGDELEGVPFAKDVRQIAKMAVHLCRHRRARKPFGDRLRRLERARPAFQFQLIAVF